MYLKYFKMHNISVCKLKVIGKIKPLKKIVRNVFLKTRKNNTKHFTKATAFPGLSCKPTIFWPNILNMVV